MSQYLSHREYWESELFHMHRVEVWKAKATELKCAVDLLVTQERQPPAEKVGQVAFFSANIARMLMAYALENLIKAHFFHDDDRRNELFTKEGNLKGAIQWHKLYKLIKLVGVAPTTEQKEDLELLTICSVWKGRYPFPINEGQLPRVRKPSASPIALLINSGRRLKRHIEKGEVLHSELWDRTHSGIGAEYDTFNELFDFLSHQLDEIEKKAAK